MFHRDARRKEKEEEIRVRVYGVQAAISSLGSSMIVYVYDYRTTRTIYVHTIAATTISQICTSFMFTFGKFDDF